MYWHNLTGGAQVWAVAPLLRRLSCLTFRRCLSSKRGSYLVSRVGGWARRKEVREREREGRGGRRSLGSVIARVAREVAGIHRDAATPRPRIIRFNGREREEASTRALRGFLATRPNPSPIRTYPNLSLCALGRRLRVPCASLIGAPRLLFARYCRSDDQLRSDNQ
jgi:hypothetical protein